MIQADRAFDKRVDRISLILVVLLSAALAGFYSIRASLSVAAGGVLSAINFHWLKNAVDFVILNGAEGKVGTRVALRYAGRYALIALTLYATIRFSVLDLVFLLVGLLIYVVAVLLESIFEIGRTLIKDYRNGRT